MGLTAGDIAERVGGEIEGNPTVELTGFTTAQEARAGDLTFAENAHYYSLARKSKASAILVPREIETFSDTKVLIKVPNARIAFAEVVPFFFPEPTFSPGIDPTAHIDPTVEIPSTVHIGPHCVVEKGVRFGANVVLRGGDHIGADTQLGDSVHLFPGVVIYAGTQVGNRVRIHANTVIGSDGFGYVFDGKDHRKVPQIGNVVLSDDVEVGANVSIDRGTLGATVVGRGTKIDNLVQIAHNVVIGENCLIVSQAGIAGSTRLGDFVTLAGQVGLAGHLKIGNHVTVAAQSGVMHNIGDGEKWFGSPAQPSQQIKRQIVAQQQLPEVLKRVAALEKQLNESTQQGSRRRSPNR